MLKVAVVERALLPVCLLSIFLSVADDFLQKRRGKRRSLPNLSPDYSGAFVVLVIGLITASIMVRDYREPADLLAPMMIALATVAVAVLMARFAKRHEGEIGEARFDTRNRDAR